MRGDSSMKWQAEYERWNDFAELDAEVKTTARRNEARFKEN